MTIRVHVTDGFIGGGLRVWIVRGTDDTDQHVLRDFGSAAIFDTWEPIEPAVQVEPTFTVNDDIGRALLEALVRHYQGAEDTRALRADYDAALKRADAKDAVLADVLRTLAGKVGA